MHLVSCRHTMSGRRSDSHFTMLSTRCLIELTFQLAMRMAGGFPVFKARSRENGRFSSASESSFHAFSAAAAAPAGAKNAEGKSLVLKISPGAIGWHFHVSL